MGVRNRMQMVHFALSSCPRLHDQVLFFLHLIFSLSFPPSTELFEFFFLIIIKLLFFFLFAHGLIQVTEEKHLIRNYEWNHRELLEKELRPRFQESVRGGSNAMAIRRFYCQESPPEVSYGCWSRKASSGWGKAQETPGFHLHLRFLVSDLTDSYLRLRFSIFFLLSWDPAFLCAVICSVFSVQEGFVN